MSSPPGLTSWFAIIPYCFKTSDSHRHHDIAVLIRDDVAGRPQFAGAFLVLQLERHVILRNRAQKVQQILGIEPDLDIRPVVLAGNALLTLSGFHVRGEYAHFARGELT